MIDILCCIIVCLAIIQGWRKGLILALFSMVCGLIGLAAAVKLSAVLATHMKSDLHMSSRWLPVIAFILVFVLVLMIIRWVGKVAGETGSNGFAGLAEQIIRYIVIFDFISFDIQHLPVLWDQNPGYFETGSGRLASLFLDCTLWSGSNSFYYRVYSCWT